MRFVVTVESSAEPGDEQAFADELTKTWLRYEKFAQGTINGALFSATNKVGLPYSLALEMANIFEYDFEPTEKIRNYLSANA